MSFPIYRVACSLNDGNRQYYLENQQQLKAENCLCTNLLQNLLEGDKWKKKSQLFEETIAEGERTKNGTKRRRTKWWMLATRKKKTRGWNFSRISFKQIYNRKKNFGENMFKENKKLRNRLICSVDSKNKIESNLYNWQKREWMCSVFY